MTEIRRNSENPFLSIDAQEAKQSLREPNHDGRDDEDEEEEVSATSELLPVPPDGGWGWAVVFASFMIHVIADGITYTLGIFVVEWMNEFKQGRGFASLVPSILVGVTLGVGPIASVLTTRYGWRIVTIVGAVVGAAGMAVSAAAPNVAMLYASIGVVAGLGFGFIYLPAIVSVSGYFEKKRAFATGIAVCGSGFGTFIFAPLNSYLILHFEWRGAILFVAAVVLLCALLGLIFRPLTPTIGIDEASESRDLAPKIEEEGNHDEPNGNQKLPPEIQLNGDSMKPIAFQMGNANGNFDGVGRFALSHPVLSNSPAKKNVVQFGSHSRIYESSTPAVQNPSHHAHAHRYSHHHLGHPSSAMFRKDIFYAASLENIPEYKSNPKRYSRQIQKAQTEELKRELKSQVTTPTASLTNMAPDRKEDSSPSSCCGCLKSSKAFRQMVDMSLIKDSVFLIFAISNFFTSIGFNIPYVYTVDRALLLGIDVQKASMLLSAIGIANTGGRIVLGYISDKTWFNRLHLYAGCIIVCGLSMCLSNFCLDYASQVVYCAIFGVTSGAYIGLTPVVLVDLLGLDKLTNAFGLLMLFQGIASVIGPPITGVLRDLSGDFETGFYFAGGMIVFSGVILVLIPWLERRRLNTNPGVNI